MANSSSLFVEDPNLSCAWARGFLEVMKSGTKEIVPLAVTVTGFTDSQPVEEEVIRSALDDALIQNSQFCCRTVANTMFPKSLWNPNMERDKLFERYLKILPHLKKTDPKNRYGLYFERLIAFGAEVGNQLTFGVEPKNQLEHIIYTYREGNHRRSALQASLFVPSRDHTHQRQRGFPCMQHIAFTPMNRGEMAVTGFYASQYLFERAYGNYLGLCDLGRFMAHEMGLRLTQMTCIAAVAMKGKIPKKNFIDLIQVLEGFMETRDSSEQELANIQRI